MVLQYTVASAAERLPKIGYVLKAKSRKRFDKCISLLLHGLESKYAIKRSMEQPNLKGPLPYM